jgi:hypothetical protein
MFTVSLFCAHSIVYMALMMICAYTLLWAMESTWWQPVENRTMVSLNATLF